MPSVAILGGGMSGLVAAKAIEQNFPNINFDIYDKCVVNVSQQKGLHYLHGSCGLDLEPQKLQNLVSAPSNLEVGLNVQYSRKVWGNDNVLNNSLVNLPANTNVYDFREAFNILKAHFSKKVCIKDIDRQFVRQCQCMYDLTISTIPLQVLFPNAVCSSETVYAMDGLPMGVELKDFTVLYNLDMSEQWYRASNVFGQTYTEFVGNVPGSIPIKKIKTQTSLDIEEVLDEYAILLAGRFGCWDRKKLVHQVYSDVIAAITDFKTNRQVNLIY